MNHVFKVFRWISKEFSESLYGVDGDKVCALSCPVLLQKGKEKAEVGIYQFLALQMSPEDTRCVVVPEGELWAIPCDIDFTSIRHFQRRTGNEDQDHRIVNDRSELEFDITSKEYLNYCDQLQKAFDASNAGEPITNEEELAMAFHSLITNQTILAFYYQITPRFMSLITRGDAIAAFRASVVEEIYKQGGTNEDAERLTSDILKKAMRLKRSPEVVARSF